jgi:hypothetical protein
MTALLAAFLLGQIPGLCTVTPGLDSVTTTQNCMNQNTAILSTADHSPGLGTPVSPAGMLINAPLPFNGWPITILGYEVFADAGHGPSIPLSLWTDGIDLFYEDGNGNKICITKNGGLCAATQDGGTGQFTTITVSTSGKIDGVTIASNCMTGLNGASFCFDTGPGDTLIEDVDGGSTYITADGVTIAQIGPGGYSSSFEVEAAGLYSSLGSSVTAGYGACYDTGCAGNTTELAPNLVTTVPDGGTAILSVGNKTTVARKVVFDGGLVAEQLTSTGQDTFGDVTSMDAVRIAPQSGGTGQATVSVVSSIDSSVSLVLESKGPDGGVAIFGHIDTANNGGTTTISDAGNPCFGFAGTSLTLAAGSNDTAGIITFVSTDGGSTACDPNAPVFTLAFSHAFAAPPAVTLTGCDNPANVVTVGRTLLLDAGWFQVVNASNPTPTINSTYCWTYHVLGRGLLAH